jgi:hypothetical protein
LDAQGHVKLIDFGLSQEMVENEEPMSPIGSLIYMAPELLTKGTGGRHTDWWALGVLAHEVMTGRSPWSSLTDKKLIKKQIKTMNIQPPDFLSQEASDFICQLLIQDHTLRLGTQDSNDVKNASFFKQIDFAKLESGNAPAAIVPPQMAFVQTECDNALSMYRGSDTKPANWFLGVESVDSLPPVEGKDGSSRKLIPKPPPKRSKSPKSSSSLSSSSNNTNNSSVSRVTNLVGSISLKDNNSDAMSNGGLISPRRAGISPPASSGTFTSTTTARPPVPPISTTTSSSSSSSSTSAISATARKGTTTPKSAKPRTPREPSSSFAKPKLVTKTSAKASSATWR